MARLDGDRRHPARRRHDAHRAPPVPLDAADRHRGRSARDRRQRHRDEPGHAARQLDRVLRPGRCLLRAARPRMGGSAPARVAAPARERGPADRLGSGAVVAAVAARRRGRCSGWRRPSKWNGLYFLAVFAVYSVVSEVFLRRRAGVTFWVSGTLLRQGPATLPADGPARGRPSTSPAGPAGSQPTAATTGTGSRRAARAWTRPALVGSARRAELVALPGRDLQLPRRREPPARLPGEPAHLAVPHPADEHVLRVVPGWERRDDPRISPIR